MDKNEKEGKAVSLTPSEIKAAKAEAVKAEIKAEKAEKAETKADAKEFVTVSWAGGTRTYSLKVHGADFAEYAKEFASKKGGKIV